MSAASRTIAAPHPQSQLHRPKIGTLPKPKAKPAPVRTILDERYESSASDTDEDAQSDWDHLDGPDVSRIRTKRSTQPRLSDGTSVSISSTRTQTLGGSRIPSLGASSRTLPRPHRRSSGNSLLSKTTTDEKENTSISAPSHSKRHSISVSIEAAPARARSSLPLAPADNTPSPSKSASLSALRSRGLQPGSVQPLRPAARHDLGIKNSIIQANPIHPSIAALQAQTAPHQPISTPEALVKAKKRLSGALFSSSSSSLTLNTIASTSPPERAGLAHSPSLSKLPQAHKKPLRAQNVSAATVTPSRSAQSGMPRTASRSPIKSSLLLFPSIPEPDAVPSKENSKPSSPSKQAVADNATSEIDAHLLASLRVVAHKANLQLSDLLDAESQARFRREASEELEALAGDVSVDLMALDLAASPSSDASVLRSPLIAHTPPAVPAQPQPDTLTPPSESTPAPNTTPGIEDEETDTSLASPSVRAAARLPLAHAAHAEPVPSTPVRPRMLSASMASTPLASPSKACPPSASMSARSRTRLKKALRESLGLEAHYAALHLAAPSAAAVLPDCSASHKAECRNDGVALLTDSDLDDIVSAVARMDLHHAQAGLDEARPVVEVGEMGEVAELRAAQTALSTQLALAESRESSLATQLAEQAMAATRMQREHERLQADLAALRARAAGMEWAQAQTAWSRARAQALTELQDAKVEADTIMLLRAHLGICHLLAT